MTAHALSSTVARLGPPVRSATTPGTHDLLAFTIAGFALSALRSVTFAPLVGLPVPWPAGRRHSLIAETPGRGGCGHFSQQNGPERHIFAIDGDRRIDILPDYGAF